MTLNVQPWHMSRYTPDETAELFEYVDQINAANANG